MNCHQATWKTLKSHLSKQHINTNKVFWGTFSLMATCFKRAWWTKGVPNTWRTMSSLLKTGKRTRFVFHSQSVEHHFINVRNGFLQHRLILLSVFLWLRVQNTCINTLSSAKMIRDEHKSCRPAHWHETLSYEGQHPPQRGSSATPP